MKFHKGQRVVINTNDGIKYGTIESADEYYVFIKLDEYKYSSTPTSYMTTPDKVQLK